MRTFLKFIELIIWLPSIIIGMIWYLMVTGFLNGQEVIKKLDGGK